MTDWSRVPVLVGASQHTNRVDDPAAAPDPLELMAMAATGACAGAGGAEGALLAEVTCCWTVHSLSLRHSDPAGALARRLGLEGVETRCSGMGGNIPQWLLNRAAELVLCGARPVVLVAGAEALATRRRAKRQGITLAWPSDGGWPATWPPIEPDLGVHPAERAAGLDQATAMYALVETAISHAEGRDRQAEAAAMGALMERFNAVAAANAYSWFPTRRTAAELTAVTDENRLVYHPYPKYLNAVMDVDMAAAVVLTDAERARRWGFGPDEVVYLRGWADARDVWYLGERPAIQRSEALAACARSALSSAGISLDEVDAFDLYSCFPSSVEAALDALGLRPDDRRPLTLTGGLPYHGGPGSNYVTHCVANALQWLREGGGEHVLVHGNGYYLTKHAVGLYSRRPPAAPPEPDAHLQEALDGAARPVPLQPALAGRATVVAYTAAYDRQGVAGPAVVLVEADGRRSVAVAEEALGAELLGAGGVGRPVRLQPAAEGPPLARPA